MAIYTKTGDRGETGLSGKRRVSKSDPIIVANGELDELTSTLGWARVAISESVHDALLVQIQKDIYTIMGMIAGYGGSTEELALRINTFEQVIDTITDTLPKLQAFVIPGDTESSARLHVARAVCRRAERALVACQQSSTIDNLNVLIQYTNRLSDVLFTLARTQTTAETMTK